MNKLLLAVAALGLASSPAAACDEMRELRDAMRQAQASTKEARREAYQRAYDEAWATKAVIEQYLELAYFPGLFDLRTGDIAITARGDAGYQALSGFATFLKAAPGTTITVKAADRVAQFAQLKTYFRYALGRAGDKLRELDENPASSQALSSLSQWAVESSVRGAKDSVQILTHAERAAVLTPNPAPERDPRE